MKSIHFFGPVLTSVIAAALMAGGAATAAPAGAAVDAIPASEPASFTCTGTGTQHYHPGLTFTPTQTTITNEISYPVCVGTPVTSGSFSFGPFQIEASCLLGTPVGTDEIDFTWNDGSTSHFVGTFVVTRPAGQLVVSSTGSFTEGRFAGHPVESVIAYVAPNPLNCLSPPGVTSVSGPAVLTVLP